ncbi:Hsp70 family protein [Euhalothece natronophila Z-M001]|uniref:Hsp70 family protein n=1 Tax=Euhalothece natronophila Z-M001 TaxID=522448 RepID=A0A5B8NM88_9CHRO|nr:Hsp70 family protein [Euhalothece natronophila]QDZ40057.1 Hsp70 family protein [Euhalothece natronophila Z-M001]
MTEGANYAIDFGTSNTVITRWNATTEEAEVVLLSGISQQLPNNPPLIPSLLYVEEANDQKVVVGQAVRDRALDVKSDPRFFRSFKRGIAAPVQGFLPELDGKTVTFEQAGEWFLRALTQQLQQEAKTDIESLVLTVPVDSFEAYRNWLTQVCSNLEAKQIRLLDESTAAALGYGTAQQQVLLVIDFGGGTVDFSLVQLNLGEEGKQPLGFILKWGDKLLGEKSSQKVKTARVYGKAGANLGGSDIDDWLVDYFVKTQGIEKSALTTRLAERLKVQLSSQEEAEEVYFDETTLDTLELKLKRDQLEEILQEHQFFAQLDDLMTQVLQQGRRNGIEASEIQSVLLVGGSVQIPAVQNWLQGYFEESKIKCDRPFSAIASGALQLSQGLELKDFLYHSYGVRYWNYRENKHSWHPIIKAGQPYPMTTPVELTLGASVDNQPSIELVIGELGSENTGRTEVYFDGNRLVTKTIEDEETNVIPLNEDAKTIANLNPPGSPGRDRVKIKFWVDQQRSLKITVEDLLTQQILLQDQIVTELS